MLLLLPTLFVCQCKLRLFVKYLDLQIRFWVVPAVRDRFIELPNAYALGVERHQQIITSAAISNINSVNAKLLNVFYVVATACEVRMKRPVGHVAVVARLGNQRELHLLAGEDLHSHKGMVVHSLQM